MRDDFFGKTFDCPCGRRHAILPRRSIYSNNAAGELARACAELTPGRRVVVLMDARTKAAAGDEVAAAFEAAGWRVAPVVVPDPAPDRSPVCDDRTRRELDARLPEADLICPVGAGVINDLGKWIATDRKLVYVTFATAASMNGYTSANIAPAVGGVKCLLEGTAPQLVAASPRVLAATPRELTAAGLGDVLAKSVSSADWQCNHLLFDDYYCERSVRLIEELEPLYTSGTAVSAVCDTGVPPVNPELQRRSPYGRETRRQAAGSPLRNAHATPQHGQDARGTHGRDAHATTDRGWDARETRGQDVRVTPEDAHATSLAALYEALLLTGAAMTMAGTSAPASGGEHLVSHYLDMAAMADGVEHDLHGRQVGIGTILTSELYRRVLAVESPELPSIDESIDTARWGGAAGAVAAEYARKLPRLRQAREQLSRAGAWDDLRGRLAPMLRPPELIRDCLASAGGAFRAEHIGCPRQRLIEAFSRGHEIRSRFTVLDLARLAGVLPRAADEIVEEWM